MDNQQRKFDLNVSTAYLVGVYLTDGSIYKNQFYLESIDKDFCETVLSVLENILENFNKNIRYIEPRKKSDGYKYAATYRIKISSVELCQWLMKITNHKQTIPNEILNSDKEILLAFLSGLMDGDGGISKSLIRSNGTAMYQITLCGFETLYGAVKDYAKVFDKLGIQYSKREQSQKKIGFISYVLKNFSFVDAGGYFNIIRKQKRLNDMITMFKDLPTCSKNKILNGIRSTTKMTTPILSDDDIV